MKSKHKKKLPTEYPKSKPSPQSTDDSVSGYGYHIKMVPSTPNPQYKDEIVTAITLLIVIPTAILYIKLLSALVSYLWF